MRALIMAAAIAMATSGALAAEKEDHGHPHGDHSHANDHGHGEPQDLGTTAVAGIKFEAFQMGKLSKEGVFEVVLAKGTAKPKAIRVWVGNETAEGSVKVRAEGDGPAYDMHVELPNPLPKDARFWVEIQPAEGNKGKTSFALKR